MTTLVLVLSSVVTSTEDLTFGHQSFPNLVPVMQTLRRRAYRSYWARQIEVPQKYWIIGEWESASALDSFLASSEYIAGVLDPLKLISEVQFILRCPASLSCVFWEARLEIVLAYFPADLSEETYQAVDELRGIHPQLPRTTAGAIKPQSLICQSKGWAVDPVLWHGHNQRIFVVFRVWEDQEKERYYKANERLRTEQGLELVVDAFEAGLRRHSMVGCESAHGSIQPIYFNDVL
ncbi:hypothetical protein ACLMJK_003828 [Lecanora helva]